MAIGELILAVSRVTDDEYASLVATFLAMTDEDFRCESCLVKFKKRPDGEKQGEYWRTSKGCYGATVMTPSGKWEKHHVLFPSCPGNFRDTRMGLWIDLWRGFNAGHLPFAGGLLDQPAKLMEAFKILDSLSAEKTKGV